MSATRKLKRNSTSDRRRDKRREAAVEAKNERRRKLIQQRNHVVARRNIREAQKEEAEQFNKDWEKQVFSWRTKVENNVPIKGTCTECGDEDVDLFFGAAHVDGERLTAVDVCQKCAIEIEGLARA